MPARSDSRRSKLMSEREAIARFVDDGDTVYCGFTMLPLGLTYEIIRQRKRRLKAVGASNVFSASLLALAGCVDRMESGYIHGALFDGPITEMMQDGRLRYEDYSNLTITLRFMAGALGMPFIPSNSFLGTDYLNPDVVEHARGLAGERTRADGTTAPKYVVMESPFKDGRKTVLLPPLRPDVALFHCQRADEYGNVQAWGPLADTKWALWASTNIIVSAEEIVPPSVVHTDPGRTIFPGFRVSAVVHNPWGAHPGTVPGHYARDRDFLSLLAQPFKDWESAERYLAEWVRAPEDRAAYVEQYRKRFGSDLLDGLRVRKPVVPEQPVRYGWH